MHRHNLPILDNKVYDAPSIFTAENLLREARRQKSIKAGSVPSVCILDPDGDIVHSLVESQQAALNPYWACYHTKMYTFEREDMEYGIVPHVVGASFAVLVAEELFSSGCQLVVSVTSAGQIIPARQTPYFVLIERALRDEGTSYHYLPPSDYSHIDAALSSRLRDAFQGNVPVLWGASWTTDAPFRETQSAINYAESEGILAVEMEAAALYALAQAKGYRIVCFAHVTNQMASIEGDFEKGQAGGSLDALHVIGLTARQLQGVR